jgi:hypothetical protein
MRGLGRSAPELGRSLIRQYLADPTERGLAAEHRALGGTSLSRSG